MRTALSAQQTQRPIFARILDSVVQAGRRIRAAQGSFREQPADPVEQLGALCAELVQHRGEASGLALAREILDAYQALPEQGREQFLVLLQRDFSTDPDKVARAAAHYGENPNHHRLDALRKAVESPCVKLFRRLNMAPQGTSALVAMRGHLLSQLPKSPELAAIESDLKHLLIAWFNPGFLDLQRIDWDSPASVLEKIIEYEAVHEINGWGDLRNRLKSDRRLFAFFHPAMPDDPVIFVEIALGRGSATAIEPLICAERPVLEDALWNTATFYSISNCHAGLRGISFGNFLIKQVATNLRQEMPGIARFETLSPVPGFRTWIEKTLVDEAEGHRLAHELEMVGDLLACDAPLEAVDEPLPEALRKLCAYYLMHDKQGDYPRDPVARFHLGNGAKLDQIHWAADTSDAGRKRSLGIMVNYLYEEREIEKNHEAYFAERSVVAATRVRKLAG